MQLCMQLYVLCEVVLSATDNMKPCTTCLMTRLLVTNVATLKNLLEKEYGFYWSHCRAKLTQKVVKSVESTTILELEVRNSFVSI